MFIFMWHLAIALIVIAFLYLGATYSSLRSLIEEVHAYQEKMQALQQEAPLNEKLYNYYKERYNKNVQDFNYRKTSIFAVIVLRLFKKLDINFKTIE